VISTTMSPMAAMRTILDFLLYVLVRFVDALVQLAGPDIALFYARRLGQIWWAIDRRHRDIALTNLRNSFPDWTEQRRAAVGQASFQGLVCFVIDVLLTPGGSPRATGSGMSGWSTLPRPWTCC